LIGGLLGGIVIYLAASLQQLGIVYTTAGSAGFITSLYVIFVPVLGLFIKHKINLSTWIGVIMALAGLYFLSVTKQLTLEQGDGLVFLGAISLISMSFFWIRHEIFFSTTKAEENYSPFSVLFKETVMTLLAMTVYFVIDAFV